MSFLTTWYLRINRVVEQVEKYVAVLIISAIVLIVFTGTVSRYIFQDPLFGTDRLATYLMVWLGFLGFQIATSRLRHIEVEAVKSRLPDRWRYLFSSITALAACVFLVIMTFLAYAYWQMSYALEDRDIVLDLPLWWIIAIIPVSFAISAVRSLFNALLWLEVRRGKLKEDDIRKKELL